MGEVHTVTNPYCDDLTCWCHTSVEYHEDVTNPLGSVDEEEVRKAYAFLGLSAEEEEAA